MIKIENAEIYGWEVAIRGMRNPMNSWDKSDSAYADPDCEDCPCADLYDYEFSICKNSTGHCYTKYVIGDNDLKLMQTLGNAGDDHGKVLRFINVTFDVTAPLYWWKEFDTYRVGVVPHPTDIEMNSCSTMHKIHAKEFTLDDFSHEHLITDDETNSVNVLNFIINVLNFYRTEFLETKDKKYWWQIIQLLPASYNQKRTIQLNYQVLKHIYHARKNHKLDEWHDFCDWIETLPYAKELICGEV